MTTISIIAVILYLVSWALLITKLRARLHKTAAIDKKTYLAIWAIGLLLHGFTLYYPLFEAGGLAIGMMAAASHIIWLTSLILLITTITHRIEALGAFILPLTALTVLLHILLPTIGGQFIQLNNGLGVHIFISLLAYSMLMLATIQAALLSEQNKHLHNHQPTGFIRTLPALQDMETLLFRFVGIGIVLLTIALATGFIYLDNLFGQHIAHKTLLSIIAWLIFTTLLIGRLVSGWRGRTAIRLTLAGFVVLMIAFFGTKLIQHFLIGR